MVGVMWHSHLIASLALRMSMYTRIFSWRFWFWCDNNWGHLTIHPFGAALPAASGRGTVRTDVVEQLEVLFRQCVT